MHIQGAKMMSTCVLSAYIEILIMGHSYPEDPEVD